MRDRANTTRTSGVTRRQLLGGTGGFLLLAACSPEQESSKQSSGDKSGFPVRIEHRYGTTEIQSPPTRIVTVGLTEQDYVLALGQAPVGTREWFGDQPGALWPWAREVLGDRKLPEVLPSKNLDIEEVLALQPDLILGMNSGLTKQQYNLLSDQIPTVAQHPDYPDYGAPWDAILETTGKALGKPKKADKLARDLKGQFKTAREKHPEFEGSTALLATSIGGKPYVYPEGPAVNFLAALGLDMPEKVNTMFGDKRQPKKLSLERLGILDSADVLVLGVYDSKSTSVATEAAYKALDIAKQGRDVKLPRMSSANGAMTFGSVLSLPVAIDLVVPRLATAIDGDPDTTVSPAPNEPR